MSSHQVWRKLRREHNTVDQLKELMQPSLDELEALSKSLGKDGMAALEEKRNNRGGGIDRGPDYTDDEQAYVNLERVIKVYNDAIEERTALDSALLDPNSFKGFIDVEASTGEKARFKPIHQKITLSEPYARFFKELKKLRQKIGRNEITETEALKQAKALEKEAGLKGVVSGSGGDVTAGNALLEQMDKDVDSLGHRPDYSGCYDGGDHSSARAELQWEINKFFIPVRNGLTLKAIPPVDVEFENAVNAIIRAVPSAVLGKAPEFHEKSERPAITTARRKLAQMAAQNPDLRNAVEAFLRASESELRDEGHIVLKRSEPEVATEGALKVTGPGGS